MKRFHEVIPYLTLFVVLLTFCYIFLAVQDIHDQLDRILVQTVETV